MEKLNQSGNIIETKEMPVSGILTGISKGYLATWDVDRGNDQYQKGCFLADIEKKKARGKNIPLKNGHGKTIGKIPIDLVFEDNIGLFIEGQINLEVQEGRETFSLIKQQAIQEFSIGYIAEQKEFANGVRKIYKSIILEGSVEPIPMNEDAIITEVKSRDTLPTKFAEKTYLFNPSDIDDNAYLFEKSLQVADMIDGELVIIPRAVINARFQMIKGLPGMTDQEKEKARSTINILYKDMGFMEPFTDGQSRPLNKTEINSVKMSTLTDILRNTFSSDATDYLVTLISSSVRDESKSQDVEGMFGDLLSQLKKTKETI